MDNERQRREVDRNYDAFQRMLAKLVVEHRDQYALMREGRIVDFFEAPGDAYRLGVSRFPDQIFSIQEVTDQPIDLGFFSHVAT